jgi:hypothetical protein
VLLSLLAAAVLGAALLAFVYLALRSSVGTVALLLVAWIVTVALRDRIDLSLTVSDVRVLALDVIAAALMLIGVARALRRGVGGLAEGLVLALLLLLLIHVARGVTEFGVQTGINGGRQWLYFTAALVYASTVPGGWDRRVWKVLTGTGILLAAIAVPYFLTEGLASSSDLITRGGERVRATPVIAAGGLLILQAVIIAPAIDWPSRRTAIYLALAAGSVTVLLQHRTVWVAGIVVALVGSAWWVSTRDRSTRTTLLVMAAVALLVPPISTLVPAGGPQQVGDGQVGDPQVGDGQAGDGQAGDGQAGDGEAGDRGAETGGKPLAESVAEATSGKSTLTWRVEGWDQLISSHDSPSQLVFGGPAGEDWSRTISGVVVNVSAHNEFIEAYLRFGLPGAVILGLIGLLVWFRRADVGPACGLTVQAVGLLLLTQLVFGMAFGLDAAQGVIGGVFVSGLAASVPDRSRAARQVPAPIVEQETR